MSGQNMATEGFCIFFFSFRTSGGSVSRWGWLGVLELAS